MSTKLPAPQATPVRMPHAPPPAPPPPPAVKSNPAIKPATVPPPAPSTGVAAAKPNADGFTPGEEVSYEQLMAFKNKGGKISG